MEKDKQPHVCLIRVPVVLSKGRIGSVTGSPPLGVAYLAAYLRQAGVRATIVDAFGECPTRHTEYGDFDLYGLTSEELVLKIPADTDLIGVSCMFSNEWFYTKKLIRTLRGKFPKIPLVMGGEHASALADYNMQTCAELDYIIRGEGEHKLLLLVRHLFSGEGRIEDIPGLVFRPPEADTPATAAPRDLKTTNAGRIAEIDHLPWPAWDLVPLENYLSQGIATITASGKRIMPILSSRGCPFGCKFCSNRDMWGSRFIAREPTTLVAELRHYVETYRITGFEFHDLTTIMNKQWILELCRLLKESGLVLEWNVPTTRAETIDAEVVQALKSSGCTNICLTPDSGSKFQLADMNKRVDLPKVEQAIRCILQHGLRLKVNFVIGFPNERHRNIWRTLTYGMKLSLIGVDSLLFYRFVPYPGSEYFQHLQSIGRIETDPDKLEKFLSINTYNELTTVYSFSSHVSNGAIKLYLMGGYMVCQSLFLISHPRAFCSMVKRVWNKTPEAQIDLLLINLLGSWRAKIRRLFSSKPPAPRPGQPSV